MTITLPFVLLVLAFVAFLIGSIPPSPNGPKFWGINLVALGLCLWVLSLLVGGWK